MQTVRDSAATAPGRRSSRPAAHPGRLLLILPLVVAAVLVGHRLRTEEPDRGLMPRAAVTAPAPSRAPVPVVAAPVGASGRFAYVTGYGPVLGARGPIRRFRVAVEKPARAAVAVDFAREVDRVLGDPRSWVAGHRFRLRRVPPGAYAEFTVFLASAPTSERMCRTGGLDTGGFTSCRLPAKVIINDNRWRAAVPRYGASLTTYRQYAINHEVGHQLGHGHEACPGRGRPAPVMMQQTYGLRGCTANAWPYPDGHRYAGRPTP